MQILSFTVIEAVKKVIIFAGKQQNATENRCFQHRGMNFFPAFFVCVEILGSLKIPDEVGQYRSWGQILL